MDEIYPIAMQAGQDADPRGAACIEATAISASCEPLLTNDPGFRVVTAIETRLLSELE